jgi:hypothetical protein
MMKRCRGFISGQCGKYIFSVNAFRNSERYFGSVLLGESPYICRASKEKCGFDKWIWGDRTDLVDDLSMIVPFFVQFPGWNFIVEGIFYQLL